LSRGRKDNAAGKTAADHDTAGALLTPGSNSSIRQTVAFGEPGVINIDRDTVEACSKRQTAKTINEPTNVDSR
jgi:hypothetical protein